MFQFLKRLVLSPLVICMYVTDILFWTFTGDAIIPVKFYDMFQSWVSE